MGFDAFTNRVILRAVLTKAAELRRTQAVEQLSGYLDKVAHVLPLPEQMPVRVVQAKLAAGSSLPAALKVAYPQLTPEQRGLLAARLAKEATYPGCGSGGGGGEMKTEGRGRTHKPKAGKPPFPEKVSAGPPGQDDDDDDDDATPGMPKPPTVRPRSATVPAAHAGPLMRTMA